MPNSTSWPSASFGKPSALSNFTVVVKVRGAWFVGRREYRRKLSQRLGEELGRRVGLGLLRRADASQQEGHGDNAGCYASHTGRGSGKHGGAD